MSEAQTSPVDASKAPPPSPPPQPAQRKGGWPAGKPRTGQKPGQRMTGAPPPGPQPKTEKPPPAEAAAPKKRPGAAKGISPATLDMLAKQSQGMHFTLLAMLGAPELTPSEDELKMQLSSYFAAAAAWGVDLEESGGKYMLTAMALGSTLALYGPRFLMLQAKFRAQVQAQQPPPPPPAANGAAPMADAPAMPHPFETMPPQGNG